MPVLILGYPLVCHLGALNGYTWPGLVWLGALCLATAYARVQARRVYLALGIGCLALAGLADDGLGSAALRLPPILITGGLAILFGETLRPGRTPLIVGIAERVRGPLPPSVAAYSRGLTWFWTLLFVLLAAESALLAVLASDFWWSLFTNLINYLILAAVFLGEYAVRRRVLSRDTHEPFLVYLRGLARSGLR